MPGRMLWIDTLHNIDLANLGQSTTSLMTGFTPAETRLAGVTLMRTILVWTWGLTVHDSGEGSQMIDVGIGIGSQEAVAAGTVPDPDTETEFPPRGWIYRARHRIAGFAADQPVVDFLRIDKDIRSRRRLENGEAYLTFINNPSEGATSTIRLVGITRMLWLIT